MNKYLLAIGAIVLGFGIGLAYAWMLSPVEYVDANPALLRADFKDQYRIVIAASYASSHDLARARARLELLDTNPLAEVKAQAQRMVGYSEFPENAQLLVQLASDLEAGVVSIPLTSTPAIPTITSTPITSLPTESEVTQQPTRALPEPTQTLQSFFDEETPPPPPIFTITPRPTSTSEPADSALFVLIGQDAVCDPGIQPGLMQVTLIDSRRRQLAGIKLTIISTKGEDILFTGFKPEVGDGYADFVMEENASYSIRIGDGGTFIPNLSAPTCTDPNGTAYIGGLKIAFQQP